MAVKPICQQLAIVSQEDLREEKLERWVRPKGKLTVSVVPLIIFHLES
jgi:hypothetical protein